LHVHRGTDSEPYTIHLELPEGYQIACGLPSKGIRFVGKDFYQLVDSPLAGIAIFAEM
jgi:hypothetical protein